MWQEVKLEAITTQGQIPTAMVLKQSPDSPKRNDHQHQRPELGQVAMPSPTFSENTSPILDFLLLRIIPS